jgi:hypothetical protein
MVGTFTTLPSVTTGTCLVTQGAVTVVFSSSILSASDPIRLVRIGDEPTWFLLSRTSGTNGELSSAWALATDATATFTLVYPCVSFPFSVGQILRIWREGELDLIYAQDIASEGLPTEIVGTPRRWATYIHDSAAATPNDELLRIILDPAPQSREVWSYSFMTRATLLTRTGATTQAVPLPDHWNRYIVAALLAGVYEIRDGLDKAQEKTAYAEKVYRETRGAQNPSAVVSARGRSPRRMMVNSPTPTNA